MSETLQDTIKQIRSRLRLDMNGVVSASMRAKGIDYKLNFGVSLPQLKQIAKEFHPGKLLAKALWDEDVREFKILATMLYPPEEFTPEEATRWVSEIRYTEIAEQYCANLLQEVPFAEELADSWIQVDSEMTKTTGFILYARLCMKGIFLTPAHADRLVDIAATLFNEKYSATLQAAITAVKKFGRQSTEHANKVLSATATLTTNKLPGKEEIYNDLKFEFEYYR